MQLQLCIKLKQFQQFQAQQKHLSDYNPARATSQAHLALYQNQKVRKIKIASL